MTSVPFARVHHSQCIQIAVQDSPAEVLSILYEE